MPPYEWWERKAVFGRGSMMKWELNKKRKEIMMTVVWMEGRKGRLFSLLGEEVGYGKVVFP